MKNRIKIFVDGKSFTLVGEETEAHMQAVATYIHEKIAEIRESATAMRMDTSLAYVLAALNVADDYFKEKERVAELEGRNLGLRTRLEELMDQLDEAKAEIKELQERPPQAEEKINTAEEAFAEPITEYTPNEIVLNTPNEEIAEEIAVDINNEKSVGKEKAEVIITDHSNAVKNTATQKPQQRKSKKGKNRKR